MRTETAGVTETLIESAKKEFLEHGFQNANLRRISSESGVSTGSIYTRFGDKAGLFSAVVKPAADGLMELYLESITAARESDDPAEATSQGNEGTELVLKYIYENFDVFKLIFCRTGWSYIYEVVSHDLSYDEAQIFMKSIREFCFAGWGKVLGQNYEDLGL